ncbi:MAG TPA: hypothetical protein VLM85_32215 [Polyangiaceae bacterium]|nr:hypothetical protein [Polyangiaceae bacterium]
MRRHSSLPSLHLLVCVHERAPDDPLGAGCGARGAAVYERLKGEVASRGLHASVWVTRTFCLGVCPRSGCTVAVYPRGDLWRDVTQDDAVALLDGER